MKDIKELQKKALSNYEIEDATDGKTRILTYPELAKFKTIEQLFDGYDSVILLYLTNQNFGHWIAIIRHSDRIEFNDSYGIYPDQELKFSKEHNRKIKGQELPHLTGLLLDAESKGYNIEYNEHKLQKMSKDISTCGRHAIIRVLFKDIPLEDYVKIIKSNGKSPDYNVTMLTAHI